VPNISWSADNIRPGTFITMHWVCRK